MKKLLQDLWDRQVSLSQAERLEFYGQLSPAALRAYTAVWEWSAPRHGGEIARRHDAFYERFGAAAYYARINKIRRAFGADVYA